MVFAEDNKVMGEKGVHLWSRGANGGGGGDSDVLVVLVVVLSTTRCFCLGAASNSKKHSKTKTGDSIDSFVNCGS